MTAARVQRASVSFLAAPNNTDARVHRASVSFLYAAKDFADGTAVYFPYVATRTWPQAMYFPYVVTESWPNAVYASYTTLYEHPPVDVGVPVDDLGWTPADIDPNATEIIAPPFVVDVEAVVDVDYRLAMAYPSWPVEQVFTRQAGYHVEDYVVIDGHPVGMKPTARTTVTIRGYSTTPLTALRTPVEAFDATSRWIPSPTTWDGARLAPAAGNRPFSLEADSTPPAFTESTYKVRVGGRDVEVEALSFDGNEYLVGALSAPEEITFAAVMSIHRPRRGAYALLEVAGADYDEPSPYVHVVYDARDRVVVSHNRIELAAVPYRLSESTLCVVGFSANARTGRLRLSLLRGLGQPDTRTAWVPLDKPMVPPMPRLLIGRASGRDVAQGTFELIDAVYFDGSSPVDLDDVVRTYAAYYMNKPDQNPADIIAQPGDYATLPVGDEEVEGL